MSKVIAIANFKGGCGKTTSAIDLSAAFARLGKKVLAIDSDGQGHLTIRVGVLYKTETLIIFPHFEISGMGNF